MNAQFAALRMAFEAGRFRAGTLDRFCKLGVWASVAIAVGLGLFGRLNGLADFPLAVDEYYFIQSVKSILAHGVPSYETGGYYARGVLVQYLTAGAILIFGDDQFAYRLPAALFSLATVPLAYIYGKRLLGVTGAAALAVLLLISAWEIEFGRFARMYSALQFFTLAFFIAVHKASDDQGRRWLYLPHAIVLVTIFVHESAILLTPFLFVPALSLIDRHGQRARHWLGFVLVSSAVTVLCYQSMQSLVAVGFEATVDPYPADFELTSKSPWLLPVLPFFPESYADALLLLGFGLAAFIVCGFLILRMRGRSANESDVFGGLLLVSAALHQFLVAGAIAVIMLARHRTVDFRKRRLRAMLVVTVGLGVFWVAYAMSSREWIADTFRPEYGFNPNYGMVKGLIRAFFGWPVIINSVVLPWLEDLPLLGACALAAGLYQLATKADAGLIFWAKSPVVLLATVFLIFGVQYSVYASTRYSFFIYPFVLALILLSAIEAARAIVRRRRGDERLGTAVGVSICVAIFVMSSDFHLQQITAVASPNIRFRLGEFERYQDFWYRRWDYQSPATFINEQSGFHDGDKVVVVGLPPVSFYLRVPHAAYYARHWPLFYDHSRAGGTRDLWSNQRLLSTTQDLREYTRCAANVYIVRAVSPELWPFELEEVWGERLAKSGTVFRSLDHRLLVVRAALRTESGCRELVVSSGQIPV